MKRIIAVSENTHLYLTMIFIGCSTALGSEIKFTPFDEASFRFGLGGIIFFLGILIRPVPIFVTGLVTAATVWLLRTGLDFYFAYETFILYEHLPAALFYIVFAAGLQLINIQKLYMKPLILGLYGAIFEIAGNMTEQLFIAALITGEFLTMQELLLLVAVAFLRSFFVIGLFSTMALSEQRKRTEQLLMIGADLYVETLYIQKSMDNIERITSTSFTLYQQLKDIDTNLSLQALMLAQEIHEVKKDSERIYAGLSKIVTSKKDETFELSELLQFIFEANVKYAESIHKNIHFNITWQENFYLKEHISLLAVLNNIVANAIEAIEKEGTIDMAVYCDASITHFVIKNDGPAIPAGELAVIFDPGYTTKFNAQGFASTGIGLSHVKSIVERIEGSIEVTSENTTVFHIKIPTYKLR